ncbi:MAG: hypothetical protein Fur005_40580 [Roseiflexaceae bacterium]
MLSSILPGMVLHRTIPPEVIGGLLLGQYQLHGGVIRWAPGTEHAGQIVRHLVPIGPTSSAFPLPGASGTATSFGSLSFGGLSGVTGLTNTYQLHQIHGITQQILQIATATMVLSGLNLVVSVVGFAYLARRLNQISEQLDQIARDVAEIRTLLERRERAELRAALANIANAFDLPETTRINAFLNAQQVLAVKQEQFAELLSEAKTAEQATIYEELYCLTLLGLVRCYAELGALPTAQRELSNGYTFWQTQTRRIAEKLLIGDDPERLFRSVYAANIPSAAIGRWMDFAHGTQRGSAWLEELHKAEIHRYDQQIDLEKIANITSGLSQNPVKLIKELNRRLDVAKEKSRKVLKLRDTTRDQKLVMPALARMVARDELLSGYSAQYDLFVTHKIAPTEFDQRIAAQSAQLSDEWKVDGYIILEPTPTNVVSKA